MAALGQEDPVRSFRVPSVTSSWPTARVGLVPYLGELTGILFGVSEPVLIDMDERGRVSLGRLHPAPGPYLGVVEPDGTVVLRPAAVMTRSQARLLANPQLMG